MEPDLPLVAEKLETTMTYTRVSLASLKEVHASCHPAERLGRALEDQRTRSALP